MDDTLNFSSNPLAFPSGSTNEGVHKVILENDRIIDELMLTLRAQIVDSITNEIKQIGEPIVSDQAISWIVGTIVPYTSKIFALSFLNEKVIAQMKYEFGERVSTELMIPEKVGIDRQNRDYVKDLMIHTFASTIHKAMEGQTLKKLLEQHSVMEQITNMEKQKKFSMPKIFGGGKTEGG